MRSLVAVEEVALGHLVAIVTADAEVLDGEPEDSPDRAMRRTEIEKLMPGGRGGRRCRAAW